MGLRRNAAGVVRYAELRGLVVQAAMKQLTTLVLPPIPPHSLFSLARAAAARECVFPQLVAGAASFTAFLPAHACACTRASALPMRRRKNEKQMDETKESALTRAAEFSAAERQKRLHISGSCSGCMKLMQPQPHLAAFRAVHSPEIQSTNASAAGRFKLYKQSASSLV